MTTKPQAEHTARPDEALAIAKRAFSDLQDRFPHLQMIDDTHEAVDLSMTLPAQPGLKYPVNLHLQNIDELHFCVSNFQCGWFPCTESECAKDYVEAVAGFLSGKHRIIEYYIGKKCLKSQLQCLKSNNWEAVAISGSILAIILLIIPQRWRNFVIFSNN